MGELAVTQVLEKFYPVLANAIRPGTYDWGHHFPAYGPVQMRPDDFNAWDSLFNLKDKADKARGVAVLDGKASPGYKPTLKVVKVLDDGFLANGHGHVKPWEYDGPEHKLAPFNTDGVLWHIGQRVHLERNGGRLYRAAIVLDFFATDKEGRLAVSTQRPMRPTFPAWAYDDITLGSYLGAYNPVHASLTFNTEIKRDKPSLPRVENKLDVAIATDARLVLSAGLHKHGEIEKIEIPDSPWLRLFFDQVAESLVSRRGKMKIEDLLGR